MSYQMSYEEQLQELVDNDSPREEIVEFMKQHNEQVVDLNKIPKQNLVWTDRGAVVTSDRGHRIFKPVRG